MNQFEAYKLKIQKEAFEYTGNSQADIYNYNIRDTGLSHEDQYICCECRTIVKECEWSFEQKICLECIKEKGEIK